MGIIVYADDTTIICTDKNKFNEALKIINDYCKAYDITINVSKTKLMAIDNKTKVTFSLNGKIIEKVESFKFLGVILRSNMSHKDHIAKRKSMCFISVKANEVMGFNDHKTPLKMKGLLYNSLSRSKLTYGFETIDLNTVELKNIQTFEGNILKHSNNLSTKSRTTALTYAMGISPIEAMLHKRKIGFIIQLINNDLTVEMLKRHDCTTIWDTLFKIGYIFEDETAMINVNELEKVCYETLKRMEHIERFLANHPSTNSIRYLLNNYSIDNHDSAQFLLDPRRAWDEDCQHKFANRHNKTNTKINRAGCIKKFLLFVLFFSLHVCSFFLFFLQ